MALSKITSLQWDLCKWELSCNVQSIRRVIQSVVAQSNTFLQGIVHENVCYDQAPLVTQKSHQPIKGQTKTEKKQLKC